MFDKPCFMGKRTRNSSEWLIETNPWYIRIRLAGLLGCWWVLIWSPPHSGISSIGVRYLRSRDTTHTPGASPLHQPRYLLIIDRRTHTHTPCSGKSRLIFLEKQFVALVPICGGRGGLEDPACWHSYVLMDHQIGIRHPKTAVIISNICV